MRTDAVDLGSERATTRRELLCGGLATAALASAAQVLDPPAALAASQSDADALRRLLAVENAVAFAYAEALRTGVIGPTAAPIASLFSSQEQRHVASLATHLGRLGGGLPAPPRSIDEADRQLAALHVTKRLAHLRTERDAIELLIGAEAAAVGAYYVAISKLVSSVLVQSAAEAMAAEAQHATALRRLLHPHHVDEYVPNAFVEGRH